MNYEESVLRRIGELLQLDANHSSPAESGEIQMAALNLCSAIYGKDSPQVKSIELSRKELWASKYAESIKFQLLCTQLQGMLKEIAADVKSGRARDLQQQARGEVFGDFLTAARSALADGNKDVAAVLACGALEDALKRFGLAVGLDVYDKEMSEVVNALKSSGNIKGPQGSLLQGFVRIRNKTFHAQWDAVDTADVQSVIGFTQEFILTRFPSTV